MNHLTASELFEVVDNRLGEERKHSLDAHLAVCDRCRHAVELERSIRGVVHNASIVRAPAGLSASIMANLPSRNNDSLILRLLARLGSFVAMALVLAVIGFVIVQVSNVKMKSDGSSSALTRIVAQFTEMYTKGAEALHSRTSAITQAIESKSGAQFWNTILIVLLTFGVLAAVDKMFGKRLTKLRS